MEAIRMATSSSAAATPSPSEGAKPIAEGRWSDQWTRFTSSKLAVPGGIIVLFFVLVAILGPVLTSADPNKTDLMNMLMPPSWEHWFGTDELGRDIFSRVVYGARLSMVEGIFTVALAMLIGVPLGLLTGYTGGRVDAIIMRCIDVLLAFPGVLLTIVIVSILGPSLFNALIAVALYTMPIFARLARASTLSTKAEPYIEACRSIGMSHMRIVLRNILPNIAAPLFVMAVLRVSLAILTASSLSFLGLGAQPPTAEWGAMLATARNYMLLAPHIALFPGLALVLLVLGLNLLQDGLRMAFDPKMVAR
jgi:peptide/nickel transport system permease protein